ncbi:MAG: hypothetical protein M3N24_02695 [Actinomycetota bacterium]|nr:hypothetical protein [Actinomycetota bacterium]
MNVPLVVAGTLALLGAAIHGIAGDLVVVRRLSPGKLPSSPFGGPTMTRAMIRVAWHMATVALLTVGSALLVSGAFVHGETSRAIALVGAAASTGIAVVVVPVAFNQARRSLAERATNPRELRMFLHPGPAILIAIPLLAWVGIASLERSVG